MDECKPLHLGGFLLMQSMAGGTGAGLGAYLASALRDDYPSAEAYTRPLFSSTYAHSVG